MLLCTQAAPHFCGRGIGAAFHPKEDSLTMNRHALKRAMSMALVLVLALSALPLTAHAKEPVFVELKAEDVTLDETEFTYTGSEIRPNVTVRVDETLLTLDKEYTLDYADNVEVGTGTVTVSGIATAGYTGTVQVPFTILAAQEEPPVVELIGTHVTMNGTSFPYTGSPIEPEITVTVDGQVLTRDEDYTLEFRNNTEPGTATATICGLGSYTGEVTVEFTIVKAQESLVEIQEKHVSLEGERFAYTGKAITPKITVTVDGKDLVQDQDYTLVFRNNVNPGEAEAIIQGQGSYTGEVSVSFTIYAAPKITKGNNATWYQKGGKEDLSFTTNQSGSQVNGVKVDGKALSDSDYNVNKDGSVVTLKNSFLKKLSLGKHTIVLSYADGDAEGTFRVAEENTNPATGDNIGLWVGILFVSLTAGAGLIFAKRKNLL